MFETPFTIDVSAIEPRIFGVSGSPRKGGNSDGILEQILAGAGEVGVGSGSARLADYRFEPCIGCERCRKDKICTGVKDGMPLLYDPLVRSRGLVLVCPVHNYNVTAWMKAFIDRLYCFYDFEMPRPGPWSSRLAGQGRAALVAAVCEQLDRKDMGFTLEAMRLPLEALGYEVIDELAVLGVFGKGLVAKETEVMGRAKELGAKLGRAVLSG